MPVLDVEDLLQAFDPALDPPRERKYSLLLFQSIMFAAVAFVDEKLVEETENKSLKAVRKSFYQKARTLYDADIESDNLVLIQCLLLMSQWAENTDTTKQNWHWTGVATSLAHATRLTHNPDGFKLPQRVKSLRKRLWWCCFMRDRLLSLGMSRPMRIRDGDFDVPLLTIDDFECDIPTVTCSRTSEYPINTYIRPSLFDKSVSTKLAQIFISNVKLCVNIGAIFSVQYTTFMRGSQPFDGGPNNPSANIMLYPISNQSSDRAFVQMRDSTFSVLDNDLTEWFHTLPQFTHLSELRPQSGLRSATSHQSERERHEPCGTRTSSGVNNLLQPSSVAVQAAVLHMSYYATSSALHRPKNRSPASSKKVMEASEGMASCCAFLNKNCLIKYLPVNTITMLMASIIWHVLLLKTMVSTDGDGKGNTAEGKDSRRARDNLSELLASLRVLRNAHVGADFVSSLVEAFLTRVRTKVVSSPSTCPTSRREFEIELNCDQLEANIQLNTGQKTTNQGPPTPQSQIMDAAPTLLLSTPKTAPSPISQDIYPRLEDEDCFSLPYGADLDGYETAENTLNSILGFPDFDSNTAAEGWNMNSPDMGLWDAGMTSLNDLGFTLDWPV
ncbi:uncharacterized protein A1O9_01198 [Exophiala aquamarina CBS 119918]|uniref:Xylanolytic transcriptional activator regulatory domain-containing protein n=1 Tax=Exophiala aquamarina CBS 119918 TaxID=1182545 RepID=A0A072PTN9_9EURO|nr:uncharacterized protein A1O9_01198 [Exophiala aquamarina CBS 119918]KEF63221.1 hypothetical protein A1O9_01198 [Exophiala aquamarina CBS 119918]